MYRKPRLHYRNANRGLVNNRRPMLGPQLRPPAAPLRVPGGLIPDVDDALMPMDDDAYAQLEHADRMKTLAEKVKKSKEPYGLVAKKRRVYSDLVGAKAYLMGAVKDEHDRKNLGDHLTEVSNNCPASVVALKLVSVACILETVDDGDAMWPRTIQRTTSAIKDSLAMLRNAKHEVYTQQPHRILPHPHQPTYSTNSTLTQTRFPRPGSGGQHQTDHGQTCRAKNKF